MIYLGESYCIKEKYIKESRIFQIHMNCISIIRKPSDDWTFYDEDEIIDNGIIVFEGVNNIEHSCELEINEEVYEVEIIECKSDSTKYCIHGSNIDEHAFTTAVDVYLDATDAYLVDPLFPNIKIYK